MNCSKALANRCAHTLANWDTCETHPCARTHTHTHTHTHTQCTHGVPKQIKPSVELISVCCSALGQNPNRKHITHSVANRPRDQPTGWEGEETILSVSQLTSTKTLSLETQMYGGCSSLVSTVFFWTIVLWSKFGEMLLFSLVNKHNLKKRLLLATNGS